MIEKDARTGQVKVNGRETADNPQAIAAALRLDMVCTPRQARLAMLATPYGAGNLLQAVEAAVLASGNQALRLAWEYATEWQRADPYIAQIGAAMNLTDAAIDALFAKAMAM